MRPEDIVLLAATLAQGERIKARMPHLGITRVTTPYMRGQVGMYVDKLYVAPEALTSPDRRLGAFMALQLRELRRSTGDIQAQPVFLVEGLVSW